MTVYDMIKAMYEESGASCAATLIYENSNPTDSFSPQTMSIDLSPYTYCIITAHKNNLAALSSVVFKVPGEDETVYFSLSTAQSATAHYSRYVTVTQSSMTFTYAYYYRSDGLGQSTGGAKPYRIWGVYDLTFDQDDPAISITK